MINAGILVSIGKWGGVWASLKTFTKRVSVGWVAFTFLPTDGDDLLKAASNWSLIVSKCGDMENHTVIVTVDDSGSFVRPFVGEIVSGEVK